ncbi:DUF397 domain-containing protein [Kitasatospora sp. Ki12]|uniref:DUF397 domain-containing protein n=1 Tax=Kitasatospora xanthocidica TaxID=83382 RepID=UPI00167A402B|nr:DUF397 domain-containing protein [Kitasatospora xanthocidica]GHF65100.1 hypothetical protein GCM10018790_48700 [Kitasatospora xanthocidica]
MEHLEWQKSSLGSDTADYLEIASDGEFVYIRESNDPTHIVTTTRTKFLAWVRGAKAGEFDHFVA